jgi:hypothetical protein
MGPVKIAYFGYRYFSTKLGTPVNGDEKITSETFIEIAQEINGREPILSKICRPITANVQENVILHYETFYFCKTCAET